MKENTRQYYTTGELANMFKLPKQTLLYYDKMEILSPEFISENGYRYYSLKQYLILEIIVNMRKLGIQVSQIKEYLDNRSPEKLHQILLEKDKECEEIIKRNLRIRNDINVVFNQLNKIQHTCLNQINLNYRKEKKFLLSQVPNILTSNDSINILAKHNIKVFSKNHFKEKAVGWIIDKQQFLSGNNSRPLAYFSTLNEAYHSNEKVYTRPAGLYLTIRFQGTFKNAAAALAKQFSAFLQKNKLQAVDNLYIMPLKNHWMTPNPEEYIYQISLRVQPSE